MRNLKKFLAVIVVVAMMATFALPAFAADDTTTATTTTAVSPDANACGTLNVLRGDGSGLTPEYLAKPTNRMQAAIMTLRLLNLEDVAKQYTSEGNFKDIAGLNADNTAMLGYLYDHPELGWEGDRVNFNPNGACSTQMFYKVALTALGYKQIKDGVGDFAFADAITFAASKGLDALAAKDQITNNDMATGIVETLKTNTTAGKSLAQTLVDSKVIDATKAQELGLTAPAAKALDVASVSAPATTVVEVALNTAAVQADVDAATITMKDAAGAAVAISGKSLSADGKTISLTVAAMTTAAKYTLSIGSVDKEVVGPVADTAAPSAIAAAAASNTSVTVTFTDNSSKLDKATAENKANYTIAGLTVTAASLDGKVVTLTTSAQTSGTVYTVSVVGVKDIAGNAITTALTNTFAGKAADTTAPTVATAAAYSNTQVLVTFSDGSLIDEATAETPANYTIAGLTVNGAMLINTDADVATYGIAAANKSKVVLLTTSAQTVGTVYTVSVLGVKDAAGNAITTASTQTFAGKAADTTAPTVGTVSAYNNTKVVVNFTDASFIDATTANTAANYTIAGLTVTSAALITTADDAATYTGTINKSVVLTTSAQTVGTVYTVSVLGVKDISGNAITTASTQTFAGKAADTGAPTITGSVTALTGNQIQIVFSEAMDATSVQTLSNYSITTLGYPLSVASWTAGTRTLVLNTAPQSNGTVYTVTINNVKDTSGNAITANTTKTFAGIGDALGAAALSSVTALNNRQIKVVFNKEVSNVTAAGSDFKLQKGSAAAVAFETIAAGTGVKKIDDKTYILTINATPANALTNDVYTLIVDADDGSIIKDFGGTNIDTSVTANVQKVFGGVADAPATPAITSIVQTSARTIDVTFASEVAINKAAMAFGNITVTYGAGPTTITSKTNAGAPTLTVASDNKKVTITFTSDIAADQVAKLNILAADFANVTDITGNIAMVKNATTNYEVNFGTTAFSTSALALSSATAVDEQTLELAFNTPIIFNGGNALTIPDDANFVVFTTAAGGAVTHDIKYAEQTDATHVRVYFTNTGMVEGSIYKATIQDHANGDSLFVRADDGTTQLAASATTAVAQFGFNSTANAAPTIVSVTPLSKDTVQVIFSESLNAKPTEDGTGTSDIQFYNGATQITAANLNDTVTDLTGEKKVFSIKLDNGVFTAGTTYTAKIPLSVTLTDKYGVDALVTDTVAAPTQADVTFGGVGTVGAATATTAVVWDESATTLTITGTNFAAANAGIDVTKIKINGTALDAGDSAAVVTNATTITITITDNNQAYGAAMTALADGTIADYVDLDAGWYTDSAANAAAAVADIDLVDQA